MGKKLLFFSELSAGHLNVSISIAKLILKFYKNQFEIWFLVNKEYEKFISSKINDKDVQFLLYSRHSENNETEVKEGMIKFFGKFGEKWAERDRLKFIHNGGHTYRDYYEDTKNIHPQLTKIIKELKPDLILVDTLMTIPTGINLGIPYVVILSAAPTYIGHLQLPPPRSGLSGEYTESNIKIWSEFIEDAYHHPDFLKFKKEFSDWLKEENAPVNFDDKYMYFAPSPYLNIYNYPDELDYTTDIVRMPGNWLRIDSAVVDNPVPFSIPDKLMNLPGKLILFSLGSMASCYKPLMNRLLKLFSEIEHRFIVSTGLIGEEYELYENQYGEKFLNQLSVLQTVDLYITHCGNNGLTEACHYGVPMIAIPLFADQIDNAKRIEEKGYGLNLNPFHDTKEDFESAIEFCLRKEMKEKYLKMSKRMKKDNNLKNVCDSILNLL